MKIIAIIIILSGCSVAQPLKRCDGKILKVEFVKDGMSYARHWRKWYKGPMDTFKVGDLICTIKGTGKNQFIKITKP
jgi:hypothetical protein